MNPVYWLAFHLEVRLESPCSWLETRRGTTQAGRVAGLRHVQSHVAVHNWDRRGLNTLLPAGERAWRPSQQCSWPHLYLLLSQLKEIERCEPVMVFLQFYPFIRCTGQWFQTLLFNFLKNLLLLKKLFLFLYPLKESIFYSSLISRTWVLWFLCFPRGKMLSGRILSLFSSYRTHNWPIY